jgi:hypothetical protein
VQSVGGFDGGGAKAGGSRSWSGGREGDASVVGRCRAAALCSGGFECVCGAGPKLGGEGGRLGARCSVGREAGGGVWGGYSCSIGEGKI